MDNLENGIRDTLTVWRMWKAYSKGDKKTTLRGYAMNSSLNGSQRCHNTYHYLRSWDSGKSSWWRKLRGFWYLEGPEQHISSFFGIYNIVHLSVRTGCFTEPIDKDSCSFLWQSPKALSQRGWGPQALFPLMVMVMSVDIAGRCFCFKDPPFPCQRLASESATHCQIFPVSFYLTELKMRDEYYHLIWTQNDTNSPEWGKCAL